MPEATASVRGAAPATRFCSIKTLQLRWGVCGCINLQIDGRAATVELRSSANVEGHKDDIKTTEHMVRAMISRTRAWQCAPRPAMQSRIHAGAHEQALAAHRKHGHQHQQQAKMDRRRSRIAAWWPRNTPAMSRPKSRQVFHS
jgi:hypothetical protein